MGYLSYGSGRFKLREGKLKEEAINKLEEQNFFDVYDHCSDDWYDISFSEMKLYYAGIPMQIIGEYFDGNFTIYGEESPDVWKLMFKDGHAYRIKSRVVFGEPEEIDLNRLVD